MCDLRNCPSGKSPFGEISIRGKVIQGTVRRENYELSIQLSVGEISSGKAVRQGKASGQSKVQGTGHNLQI